MSPGPVLSIRDLAVELSRDGRYHRILDGVGFDIAAGEILALVGESGSGKSSIGFAIQGLLPAEVRPRVSGSIRLADRELVGAGGRELREARRSLVRSVPQDPLGSLDPTMTIRRQMAESGHSDGEIADWLQRTGLVAEHVAGTYPHRLSGGQRQRVLIAMAMMAHPRLLIADEPTTALDLTTQAQILLLLRELAREQGTAVLLITHDLAVAASLADRIAVLHAGHIVEQGPASAVVGAPRHPHTAGLLASRFDLFSDRTRPLPVAGEAAAKPWPVPLIETTPALRLEKASKAYARRPVLNAIDLSIRVGECVALVGESGAGKSTLLRLAAGLIAPDSGLVVRAEASPQVVFQDPVSALTPWLRIGEQVAEPLRALRISAGERLARTAEALRLVGLDPALASALPAELSIGQCQRAVLARAIVVPPKLLLCDEPVSAMDVSLSASILNLLGDLRRRLGMAILFVTHDIAAARIVADRIAVLKDGELIEEGGAEAVIATPTNVYTRSLIDALPSLAGVR